MQRKPLPSHGVFKWRSLLATEKFELLDEDMARVYLAEVVLALEYLHSLNVMHRDLKPDDLLISLDGHLKLTDFGLSKVGLINSTNDWSGPSTSSNAFLDDDKTDSTTQHSSRRELLRKPSVVGTPDDLAPEILLGMGHGATADWWFVGVILFELLVGIPPFNAESQQQIFNNIMNQGIHRPKIPEEMSYETSDLINPLLIGSPAQRLGETGAREVKGHIFFKDINWDTLTGQKAMLIPSAEGAYDTSYFTSRHIRSPEDEHVHGGSDFDEISETGGDSCTNELFSNASNDDRGECGSLADFSGPNLRVEHSSSNFSFKNLSQLALINYDLVVKRAGVQGAIANAGTEMGIAGNLSSDHLQSFYSKGFFVIESFASPEEIESMRNRMDQLLDEFDCSTSVIFSTKDHSHAKDNYFYDSAENISFFFEEKAFDVEGKLKQPKKLSINKVGHALHELDPVFRKFSSSEKMSGLLSSLSYKRPVIIQSMYIFKQPGIGGEVVPHQDNSFLYTEPTTCTGLWLALEDATVRNGCLWAIAESHKKGLMRRFIRGNEGVHFDQPSPSYDQKDFLPIEVKAGSLVVIHGDLVHQSFENQSSTSRHAYSLHVVDTDGCKWAEDNWIRRTREPEPLYFA
ncbi:hypothetical protein Nepgr_003824 [Nepenthes gracilis]|uniref:non-specific serine/threonine protein kinase n=1 Tax=Nepenthes gracilis TaxID=150966 RepID=A0AAD3S091_NEPGR|nr:hypothetical protein Nepgr_003824 [Nepenthes gracilis]